jgi:LacI family transcriptional regulator
MAQTKQVAFILETSNDYDKGFLKGIKQYAQENQHWSVYMCDLGINNPDLTWLSRWKGDGILARVENEQITKYILELNLPTIDLSSTRLIPELPFVGTKDYLTAQMAADHLLHQGYQIFAFCGDTKQHRYNRMHFHFQTYLEKLGYPCNLFNCSYAGKSKMEEKIRIARWIEDLPKPIGVFACTQGLELFEACQLAGVSVPDEAAVIGFDKDEILCELLDRQLSTVILNTARTGYNAACLLDQIMAERENQLDENEEITNLHSAEALAKKDKYVSEALTYIHSNACEGITVNDVLTRVPLSRRMLEHRFRKTLGRTPHEEIIAVRLKYVKQLLADTNLTLVSIADRAGFKHTEYLSVVFKRELGISPSQYRKLNARRRLAVN